MQVNWMCEKDVFSQMIQPVSWYCVFTLKLYLNNELNMYV